MGGHGFRVRGSRVTDMTMMRMMKREEFSLSLSHFLSEHEVNSFSTIQWFIIHSVSFFGCQSFETQPFCQWIEENWCSTFLHSSVELGISIWIFLPSFFSPMILILEAAFSLTSSQIQSVSKGSKFKNDDFERKRKRRSLFFVWFPKILLLFLWQSC